MTIVYRRTVDLSSTGVYKRDESSLGQKMDLLSEIMTSYKPKTQIRDQVTELIVFENTQKRLERAEQRAIDAEFNQFFAV